MDGARGRRAGSKGCAGVGWSSAMSSSSSLSQHLQVCKTGGAGKMLSSGGIGIVGCTGGCVIVKGIIAPEDEVPPEGKVPPATGSGPG